MYEHRTQPLLSRREFALRLAKHGSVSMALIAGLLVAPVAHRLLHRLHLDESEDS